MWWKGLVGPTPARNRAAIEILGLAEGDRLLDIGCGRGSGIALALQAGAVVAGVDTDPNMVRQASTAHPTAEVVNGGVEALPFGEGVFTAAMAVSNFHHWNDRTRGVSEVHRVLAPSGRVLILERLGRRPEAHGVTVSEVDTLVGLLKEAGFIEVSAYQTVLETGLFVVVAARVPAN